MKPSTPKIESRVSRSLRKAVVRASLTALVVWASIATAALGHAAAPKKPKTPDTSGLPKPRLQNDYFFSMPRAPGVLQSFDAEARSVTVKLDNERQAARSGLSDNRVVTVPLRPETELTINGASAAPEDFYPGLHVMLFVMIDENHHWLWSRSVSDDISFESGHDQFSPVAKIDRAAGTYATHRIPPPDKQGRAQEPVDRQFSWAPDVKVWKGPTPGGIETLREGDEVIEQLAERDGKLVAVGIMDRAGVKARHEQLEDVHRQRQDQHGLAAYTTDVQPLSGQLTITIGGRGDARRVRELGLNPGDMIVLTAPGEHVFGARFRSMEPAGSSRQRVTLDISAFAAAGLSTGGPLRIWVPHTGPPLPTGKLAPPDLPPSDTPSPQK